MSSWGEMQTKSLNNIALLLLLNTFIPAEYYFGVPAGGVEK
jgi:hypothetical protein